MKASSLSSIVVIVIAFTLIAPLLTAPSSQADEAVQESIPLPCVDELHKFNLTPPGFVSFVYEQWYLAINHGDVMTLLQAKREGDTFENSTWDYTMNIHHDVGGVLYITQFMMTFIKFKVGGEEIGSALYCEDFVLTHTPLRYEGERPAFYCNMTYLGVDIYHGEGVSSRVDITLSHHLTFDWNRTDVKVEAIIDLSDTVLYDGEWNEIEDGESFAVEVIYSMALGCPGVVDGPLVPTSYSNTTLEYNITQDNGVPLTVSKMNMLDDFVIGNATGTTDSISYSWVEHHTQTWVAHGFPGLIYKDTLWVHSDPEVSVLHDRAWVWEEDEGGFTLFRYVDPLVFAALVAVLVVAIVSLIVWKRKRAT